MQDLLGTVTFIAGKTVKKSGDTIFTFDPDAVGDWNPEDDDDPKRKANSFVAIPIGDDAEFRHTLRRNVYGSGMEHIESFDVEYRIVNVVEKKASKPVTTRYSKDPTGDSVAAVAEILTALGDAKGLTALFESVGLAKAVAKSSAKAAIEAHKA